MNKKEFQASNVAGQENPVEAAIKSLDHISTNIEDLKTQMMGLFTPKAQESYVETAEQTVEMKNEPFQLKTTVPAQEFVEQQQEGYVHVIDPMNRIEGDLAVEITVDTSNTIVNAKCLGFVYRGFENIFKGKKPYDAMRMSTRSCGVCPISHGTAGAQALESLVDFEIPRNAQMVRDIVLGANTVVSHATHFYFMWGPDLVNSVYQNQQLYQEIKKRFDPLKSPHLKSILLNARVPLHKLIALFGGRFPHATHAVPGGVTYFPKSSDIFHTLSVLRSVKTTIENEVLNGIPVEEALKLKSTADVLKLMDDEQFAASDVGAFLSYAQDIGLHQLGEGSPNRFLSSGYGRLDDGTWLFKPGFVENGTFYPFNHELIKEDVSHSYYENDTQWQHPWNGVTNPIPRKEGAYSWIKSPRYDEKAVEVGPLARQIVNNDPLVTDLVNTFGVNTFTRTFARLYECLAIYPHIMNWVETLDLKKPFCYPFPEVEQAKGFGIVEAPRGAVGHWVGVENSVVKTYQIITPTTWNLGAKDAKGQHGACEQALIGVKLRNQDSIIEAGHIVRSFDPCISCSIHAIGKKKGTIRVEATR